LVGVLVLVAQDGGQRGVVRVHLVVERERAVRECADDERLARLEIEGSLPPALEVGAVLASPIDDPQPQRCLDEAAMPGGDIRTEDHDVLIRSRTERVMPDSSSQQCSLNIDESSDAALPTTALRLQRPAS
jgi:hypothetical protein